jgi:hypothetical protein
VPVSIIDDGSVIQSTVMLLHMAGFGLPKFALAVRIVSYRTEQGLSYVLYCIARGS